MSIRSGLPDALYWSCCIIRVVYLILCPLHNPIVMFWDCVTSFNHSDCDCTLVGSTLLLHVSVNIRSSSGAFICIICEFISLCFHVSLNLIFQWVKVILKNRIIIETETKLGVFWDTTLVSCSAYYLTLKMEAIRSPETSLDSQWASCSLS
jgi:hypothetical protein